MAEKKGKGSETAQRANAEPLYGNRETFWQGQVGVRSTFVTDSGFDPFATDNVLTTSSIGFSRTVFDLDRLGLVLLLSLELDFQHGKAVGQFANSILSCNGFFDAAHQPFNQIRGIGIATLKERRQLLDALAIDGQRAVVEFSNAVPPSGHIATVQPLAVLRLAMS